MPNHACSLLIDWHTLHKGLELGVADLTDFLHATLQYRLATFLSRSITLEHVKCVRDFAASEPAQDQPAAHEVWAQLQSGFLCQLEETLLLLAHTIETLPCFLRVMSAVQCSMSVFDSLSIRQKVDVPKGQEECAVMDRLLLPLIELGQPLPGHEPSGVNVHARGALSQVRRLRHVGHVGHGRCGMAFPPSLLCAGPVWPTCCLCGSCNRQDLTRFSPRLAASSVQVC